MKETRFIDTSVLLEILEVPNRCDDSKKYQTEFAEFALKKQATIIMPISVLIETGNHINHIKNNPTAKKNSVDKFISILDLFVNDTSPWSFYGYDFGSEDVTRIVNDYNDLVYSGVGIGDAFIIDSYNQYIQKLKLDNKENHQILIWSKDKHLSAFNQII